MKPTIALLNPNGDGTLSILNSFNNKLINKSYTQLKASDLDVAAPVKVKYDPE
jgi:hypothetical protein